MVPSNSGIAYFDPDITVKIHWEFFENWISHGVAIVHEISSNDMPLNHPIRNEWIKIISTMEMNVTNQVASYINAGFCGISDKNIEFLRLWEKIIMIGVSQFNRDPKKFMEYDRTYVFHSFGSGCF